MAWFACHKMIKRINLHRHLSGHNLRLFLFWHLPIFFVTALSCSRKMTKRQQFTLCLHKQLKCEYGRCVVVAGLILIALRSVGPNERDACNV